MGRDKDGALSPLLGFIVAIAVYALALTAFMSFANTPPTESSTIDADLRNRAASALDLVITDSGGAWVLDPDAMTRFGLADDAPNFIDYDKIVALRKGKLAADASNDEPDYPEVRSALGLTDHQFHLRTYPVLVSVDDANWARMRGFKAAYLADYAEPVASATVTPSLTTSGDVKIFNLQVTNTGSFNQFTSTFTFTLTDGPRTNTITTSRQTRPLATGETDTMQVRIHPLKSWDEATIATMTIKTSDNYGTCCATKWINGTATVNSGSNNHLYHIAAETGASYYKTTETPRFDLDHWDKDGKRLNSDQSARVRVYEPTSAGAITQYSTPGHRDYTVTLPKNKDTHYDCVGCANKTGLWKVVVTPLSPVADTTRDVVLYYWVNSGNLFTSPTTLTPEANNEAYYIWELLDGFQKWKRYTTGNLTGDIFADQNQAVKDLEPLLDVNPVTCDGDSGTYDMLIVGSNTAHSALVKIKDEVAKFVECGGTLIALGSSRSGTEWLQSVYHVALRDGAGGGIASPDPTHPLLNVPEKLGWNSYSDTDYVWKVDPDVDIFSHAVNGGASDELMLGVSKQGALNGSVVLTGWTPGSLTTPQDPQEAKRLLHNLMTQGYQMLFLDYGPEIPQGVPVGSSSRLAAVQYTELDDAPFIEVSVVLYAWRG